MLGMEFSEHVCVKLLKEVDKKKDSHRQAYLWYEKQ